ncbi:unnamed protein product [Ilex paraguariensis]|uniref:Nucleotide-diphospho-sugar transferase domain-containing protein n=1 Tax=Ilex paraguariensis TaxID=185542 RepID=A0ABC8SR45_9AQUA
MMDSAGASSRINDEKSLESGGHHHNHNNHFFHLVLRISLLFLAVVLACLVLYHSVYSFQFFPNSMYNPSASSQGSARGIISSLAKDDPALVGVLKEAAMTDKTVIITTLNEAWAAPNSIFELFLKSFRIGNQTQGLLNHLLVVALDQKAYARCLALHDHCYTLNTPGIDFSSEAHFMSTDYLKMMWRRIDFLRIILEVGYNFIFTDNDIMWFRDPFPHFYPDADFQIACDRFYGNSFDLNNSPNGGFTYVKSSKQTIEFYKFWYGSRDKYPGKHDQDVLNMIKFDPFIRKIGLQIRFLDTAYFGGFCQPSKDLNLVCTMHANCCVGLDNKIHDLTILLEDWRKYMSSPTNKSVTPQSSWSPRRCS